MYIGLTGLIGAGKTSAATILKTLGAVVIDADRVARDVLDIYPALRNDLVKTFGSSIVTTSGRLRRKKLAQLAFTDEASSRKLDRLIHPYIAREIRTRMKKLNRRHRLIVIDAALLIGSSIENEMDRIIVIHASKQIRLQRLLRRGMSREDALNRMARQLPLSVLKRRADAVIINQDSIGSLKKKLVNYLKKIVPDSTGNG